MATYQFFDGNFFWRFVEDMEKGFESEKIEHDKTIEFNNISKYASRSFFYDALPVVIEGKDEEEKKKYQTKRDIAESRLKFISDADNFVIRSGVTRHSADKNLEQKGVDILLALDCYQHAVINRIDIAVIFASDLDFYPLLEALFTTATRSLLRYDIRKTNVDLITTADSAIPLTAFDYMSWLEDPKGKGMRRIYTTADPDHIRGEKVGNAKMGEKIVDIFKRDDGFLSYTMRNGKLFKSTIRFLIEHSLIREYRLKPKMNWAD